MIGITRTKMLGSFQNFKLYESVKGPVVPVPTCDVDGLGGLISVFGLLPMHDIGIGIIISLLLKQSAPST